MADQQIWYFIINPFSGGGKAQKRWPSLQKALIDQGVKFECQFSQSPEHAIEIAQQAALQGYRYFVAVGGDGTINEVLQGLASSSIALNSFYFTAVPWGTGNDWAAMHQLPSKNKDIIKVLVAPDFILHDVGLAQYGDDFSQQRYFINFLGTGFDSFLLQRMGAAGGKRWRYYLHLLSGLWAYQSPEFVIDDVASTRSLMLMCCIGRMGGAGMKFAPSAAFDDGYFDRVNIQDMPFIQRLMSLPYLMNGKIQQHRQVQYSLHKQISIDTAAQFYFQCDGELIAPLPVKVSMQAKALHIARAKKSH